MTGSGTTGWIKTGGVRDVLSPVPKCEGPGAPGTRLEKQASDLAGSRALKRTFASWRVGETAGRQEIVGLRGALAHPKCPLRRALRGWAPG